ncbi:hypothetical protein O181_073242 [Austropuccinia psidii MF-1]|uniref:Uncharacterized protein n=1 Tax=Austropuccinia psidii MF-1 TaxID=1389203 RepID=A0A9Q3F8N5_9BASI|nr:hypothetical protein [Austropuccinia psidii MF-1]
MAPRQPLKFYHFLEERNSTIRCNNLTEYLEKRIVPKHGGTYLFPNFQRVPTEGPMSAKELVRKLSKQQEKFIKKMIEKLNPPQKQQKTTVIEDHQDGKEAAIAHIEEWRNWKPFQI